ncbi:jg25172 [Pararge aegeria aegeria]|uniref:Jg25172 protein n=1 Tax=Pararge aegeria aegeria TaxID=348720 RepID=A0A8S4RYN2_9NEOP|nr:jg25172 [Pararge aegeria aegeria]
MFLRIFFLCALIAMVSSRSVRVGKICDPNGKVKKIYDTTIDHEGIPLYQREEMLYFLTAGDQKIKGIVIKDIGNGLTTPSIIKGGVGYGFVRIDVKSELGGGYNFQLQIYA